MAAWTQQTPRWRVRPQSAAVVLAPPIRRLVGIGDFSQDCQRLPKLCSPGLAEICGPLRLDFGDHTHAGLHRGGAARCDANQARATIPRIGRPLNIAGALELVDQEAYCLLGQDGRLGEVGDPRPILVYPLEHPRLGRV